MPSPSPRLALTSLAVLVVMGCTPEPVALPASPPMSEPTTPEAVTPEPAAPEPATPEPTATSEPALDPAIAAALAACERSRDAAQPYPHELEGYLLSKGADWATLVPLVSTLADVRAALGEPREATDIGDFGSDYPGDDAAIQPLLIYDQPGPWDLYVYLVASDLSSNEDFPAALQRRVGTLELIPEGTRPSFAKVRFPAQFQAKRVVAADAGWVEHRDESGLTYQVYGDQKHPGLLNRISYGPSDCQLAAVGVTAE